MRLDLFSCTIILRGKKGTAEETVGTAKANVAFAPSGDSSFDEDGSEESGSEGFVPSDAMRINNPVSDAEESEILD